jgi:hypothetical protein
MLFLTKERVVFVSLRLLFDLKLIIFDLSVRKTLSCQPQNLNQHRFFAYATLSINNTLNYESDALLPSTFNNGLYC